MARQKKEAGAAKSHKIQIRVTDLEYTMLKAAAKAQGITLSDLILTAAKLPTHAPLMPPETKAAIHELLGAMHDISRIGNLMNEDLKHGGSTTPADAEMNRKSHAALLKIAEKIAGDSR